MSHREIQNFQVYSFVRLGTVVDFMTREFPRDGYHAFDMAALPSKRIEQASDTVVVQSVQADAYSADIQNAWSSQVDHKKRAGAPFCKIAMESHTANSNSQMWTGKGSSLSVGMAVIGYELRLDRNAPGELFACAEKEFRDSLRAVAVADTVDKWWKAYQEFTETYGHGIVTTLRLISCAFGELKTSNDSAGVEAQKQYSRSAAGGGVCEFGAGGASTAKGWASDRQALGYKDRLEGTAVAFPGSSPCQVWVSSVLTKYTGMGLSAMANETAPKLPAAPAMEVKAPPIPEVPPQPDEDPLPEKTPLDEKEMVGRMQSEQMKADGVPATTKWETYQDGLQDEASGLDENEIAKESVKLASLETIPGPDHALPADRGDEPSAATGSFAFNDYFIYDVGVTSYADLFHKVLKVRPALSKAALYLARINLFVMTRQLIASYFNFLSVLPWELTDGYITKDFAGAFEASVKDYTLEVSGVSSFSDESYKNKVRRFKTILTNHAKKIEFFNWPAYDFVVDNFDYLSNAPYGFLLTVLHGSKHWYISRSRWKQVDAIDHRHFTPWDGELDVKGMVPDACLAFPLLVGSASGARIGFAMNVPSQGGAKDWWAIRKGAAILEPGVRADAFEFFKNGRDIRAGLVGAAKNDDNRIDYNDGVMTGVCAGANAAKVPSFGLPSALGDTREWMKLIPIDYNTVNNVRVYGIPMWYQMPFDAIKSGVKGDVF
jgi:hypothetical protein